jgi:hypothetical protein
MEDHSMKNFRLVSFVAAVSVFGCSGGSHAPSGSKTVPTSDASEPALDARVTRLRQASQIDIWIGDLDGDGIAEIVLSDGSAPNASPSRSPGDAGTISQADSLYTSALADGIVLTHDTGGNLVVAPSNLNFDFSMAKQIGSFAASTIQAAVQELLDAIKAAASGACDLVTSLVNVLAQAMSDDLLAPSVVHDALVTMFGLSGGLSSDFSAPADQDFLECLKSQQTLQGCLAIYTLPSLFSDPTQFPGTYFAPSDHCYQVPSGAKGGLCPDPSLKSVLCTTANDPSGCCNDAFIFEKVFRSDLHNMAPMPVDPASGPLPQSSSTVVLGGVQIPSDVSSSLLVAFPEAGVAACVLNGLLTTRNPITLAVQDAAHCATNTTQPAHVLQGQVQQCIEHDASGVYSTIIGTGTNTRFAGLNDVAGPILLGAVRDNFKNAVETALKTINDDHLCCVGADLQGGTATIAASGGLTITPSGPAPHCSAIASDGGPGGSHPNGDGGGMDGGYSSSDASIGSDASGEGGPSGGSTGRDATSGDVLPSPPKTVGAALGDPHLATFDGVRYDCQPHGEETLVVSSAGDLEVQVRTAPLGSQNVAVIVGVAARVGKDRVAFYLDGTVNRSDSSAPLGAGMTRLTDGGRIWKLPGEYAVVWPDNSQLRITNEGAHFGVQTFIADARRGQVTGLLGNANASTADDLTTRGGGTTLTSPAAFADFYHVYVESWRVTNASSLFDYGDAQSTETFTDRSFPHLLQTANGLSDADRRTAASACQAAGVQTDWMDACLVDLTASNGDVRFAQSLAEAPPITATFDVLSPFGGPPAIDGVVPQIVVAGDDITVSGENLAALSGDATDVSVTLVAPAEGGLLTTNLPIVSSSSGRLTVSTPANLYALVSGPGTVHVTTPEGTTSSTSLVTVVKSSPFGGTGSTAGFFAAVYQLQPNTPKLPNFGKLSSLTDACSDPSVINTPNTGVPCPLTTFDVPNIDVPNQSYTQGFPGFPNLTTWFAVRFRGVLTIDTTGNYQFESLSDDGSNVYLFDLSPTADAGTPVLTQVVNNDGERSFGGAAGPVTPLVKGRYGIVVDYFQGPGSGLGLILEWAPPGQSMAIVPADHLQALVP